MTTQALTIVDLQNEYLSTGKVPLVGIDRAVDQAVRVLEYARAQGHFIVHVHHESADPTRPVFVPESDGVQFITAIAPPAAECQVLKHHPNAFLDTELKKTLDAHGIRAVTLVGAMSHMCIDATARAASDFGYQTTVIHDACATRDLQFGDIVVPAAQVHAAYMAALSGAYGRVISTQDYLLQS